MDRILSAEISSKNLGDGNRGEETLIKFNLEDEHGERREYPYFHSLERVCKSFEAKGLGKYVNNLPEDLLIELLQSCKLQNTMLVKKKGQAIPAEECIAGMTFQPNTGEEPRQLREDEAEKAQKGKFTITVANDGLRIAEQIDLLPPEGKAYDLFEQAEDRLDKEETRKKLRKARRKKQAEELDMTLEEFDNL